MTKENIKIDFPTRICVPILAQTSDALYENVEEALKYKPTLIEWRAESFCINNSLKSLEHTLLRLRVILKDIPLIFSIRGNSTKVSFKLSEEKLTKIYNMVIQNGIVDYIDIAYNWEESLLQKIIKDANNSDIQVILSAYYLKTVPNTKTLKNLCKKMHKLGADICKIEILPKDMKDSLQFMKTCLKLSKKYSIIAIGLGKMGLITRVFCDQIGSFFTYAQVSNTTDEIHIKKLRKLYKHL